MNPLLHWGNWGDIRFHFLDPLGGLGEQAVSGSRGFRGVEARKILQGMVLEGIIQRGIFSGLLRRDSRSLDHVRLELIRSKK